MHHIYRFFLLLLFLFPLSLVAQSRFSKARIDLHEQSAEKLARLGVDLSHGTFAIGRFYINDFSAQELARIEAAGFTVEVLIEDVQAYYQSQQDLPQRTNTENCINEVAESDSFIVPENYSNGSMAGFFTYQELLDQLDSMHSKYPELITQRTPIDGALSVEGRPIYWLRLSDQANLDEDEPEVLHTALHHAREPGSLSQMIFFMWYLLENYATDSQVQYLVDETEFYFIPCVNPDGYIFNEINNPEGGGLWRKNRAFNFDGSHGVDLNRNYGYQWGFDDQGSSPVPESQTYRGESPFSEPETQAVRDFCNAHNFQLALNYHTHGNLLVYPWSYSDSPTPDSLTFLGIAKAMTIDNSYLFGTGTETVGYTVNGDSDDWMYGDQVSKPLIFALTPEVGNAGFWPPESAIIDQNQSCMTMNLVSAAALHSYALIKEQNDGFLPSLNGQFYFSLESVGLQAGSFTVSLEAVSPNIMTVGAPKSFSLDPLGPADDFITYTLNSAIEAGDEVAFRLILDNGHYELEQTITKIYGPQLSTFFEDGNDLEQWEQDEEPDHDWGITTSRFHSAPSSIADSPVGNYDRNLVNTLTTKDYFDISNANKVLLNFWASWAIEASYDYVQLQVVIDEEEVYPVCGNYTKSGSPFQDFEQPVYDGQSDWVLEEIDLTAFKELADSFQLRFVLVSDNFVQGDGFFFDDLTLQIFEDGVVNVDVLDKEQRWSIESFPNPAYEAVNLKWSKLIGSSDKATLEIFDKLGRTQLQLEIPAGKKQIEVDTKNWIPGIYFYRLRVNGQVSPTSRMSILKK